jgi:DNA-binding transcriptional ArsR family regulator
MKHRNPFSSTPSSRLAARHVATARAFPRETSDSELSVAARDLNKFFKALSDQTRRKILRLLEDREYTVGEIVDNFNLSQPTISRHLSVLKEANLVSDRRKGQYVVYRLVGDSMARSAGDFFGEFKECKSLTQKG